MALHQAIYIVSFNLHKNLEKLINMSPNLEMGMLKPRESKSLA